jgi:hypothetical protein
MKKIKIYLIILILVLILILIYIYFRRKVSIKKYNCNSQGQCVEDKNGIYSNSNCEGNCTIIKKYNCNSQGQCVEDKNGIYSNSNCEGNCTKIISTTFPGYQQGKLLPQLDTLKNGDDESLLSYSYLRQFSPNTPPSVWTYVQNMYGGIGLKAVIMSMDWIFTSTPELPWNNFMDLWLNPSSNSKNNQNCFFYKNGQCQNLFDIKAQILGVSPPDDKNAIDISKAQASQISNFTYLNWEAGQFDGQDCLHYQGKSGGQPAQKQCLPYQIRQRYLTQNAPLTEAERKTWSGDYDDGYVRYIKGVDDFGWAEVVVYPQETSNFVSGTDLNAQYPSYCFNGQSCQLDPETFQKGNNCFGKGDDVISDIEPAWLNGEYENIPHSVNYESTYLLQELNYPTAPPRKVSRNEWSRRSSNIKWKYGVTAMDARQQDLMNMDYVKNVPNPWNKLIKNAKNTGLAPIFPFINDDYPAIGIQGTVNEGKLGKITDAWKDPTSWMVIGTDKGYCPILPSNLQNTLTKDNCDENSGFWNSTMKKCYLPCDGFLNEDQKICPDIIANEPPPYGCKDWPENQRPQSGTSYIPGTTTCRSGGKGLTLARISANGEINSDIHCSLIGKSCIGKVGQDDSGDMCSYGGGTTCVGGGCSPFINKGNRPGQGKFTYCYWIKGSGLWMNLGKTSYWHSYVHMLLQNPWHQVSMDVLCTMPPKSNLIKNPYKTEIQKILPEDQMVENWFSGADSSILSSAYNVNSASQSSLFKQIIAYMLLEKVTWNNACDAVADMYIHGEPGQEDFKSNWPYGSYFTFGENLRSAANTCIYPLTNIYGSVDSNTGFPAIGRDSIQLVNNPQNFGTKSYPIFPAYHNETMIMNDPILERKGVKNSATNGKTTLCRSTYNIDITVDIDNYIQKGFVRLDKCDALMSSTGRKDIYSPYDASKMTLNASNAGPTGLWGTNNLNRAAAAETAQKVTNTIYGSSWLKEAKNQINPQDRKYTWPWTSTPNTLDKNQAQKELY